KNTTGYTEKGAWVFSNEKAQEISEKDKIHSINLIEKIVNLHGYYPDDEGAIWAMAYEVVLNGKKYFDNDTYKADVIPGLSNASDRQKRDQGKQERQKEANMVASAISLLPALSTNSERKAKSAQAVYNLAKSVMREDYGAIGITSGAEALIALGTEDSINKVYTLLTEDLYRGLGTRVALYALDSLSLEEWSKRFSGLSNRIKNGLGQYHNAIARRYIYIDPKKNSADMKLLAQDNVLEGYYNVVYTDIFEEIGKALGSNSQNGRVKGLINKLVNKYLEDTAKKIRGGEKKLHTSLIVGILATNKIKSENLSKAAKIIYNGYWWDINEATQRDKNNIAASYLKIEKKKYNEQKKKDFKNIVAGKTIGRFSDIAVSAIFMGSLMLSLPRIASKVSHLVGRGAKWIKIKPAEVKPINKPAEVKATPRVSEVKAPKTEQVEIRVEEAKGKQTEYTASVGEGGGGAIESGEINIAEELRAAKAQYTSDLASKVRAAREAEALEAENLAKQGQVSAYKKGLIVNKPWKELSPWRKKLATGLINLEFNKEIFLSSLRVFKPRYAALSVPLPLALSGEALLKPVATISQTTRASEGFISTAEVIRASESVSKASAMAKASQSVSKAGEYLKILQEYSAGRGLLAGSFGITGILNEYHGGPSAGRQLSSLEKNNIINYERQRQQAKQIKNDKKENNSNENQDNTENIYEINIKAGKQEQIQPQRVAAMTPIPVPVRAGSYLPNRLYFSLVPPILLNLLQSLKDSFGRKQENIEKEEEAQLVEVNEQLAQGKAPANISPEVVAKQKAKKHFRKYQKAYREGKVQEAYDNINEAIKYDNKNAAYYHERAMMKYYNFGNQASATEDMQKAHRLNPGNNRYKVVLGRWAEAEAEAASTKETTATTKQDETTPQNKTDFVKEIKEKVFGKENSDKLFMAVLPLPKVLAQFLTGNITLEQLLNRIPAIKKAFENAEARTKQNLAEKNTSEAKDLFLGYLEEELASANIAPEKATKLLQTATEYLNGKEKETPTKDNKENKAAPVKYQASEVSVKVYDNMSVEDIIKEDPRGIIKELSKAIKENPSDDIAYYYRAKAKAELKIYKSAIKDLTKAISINPINDKYYFERAWLKRITKDYKGAKSDLDKAIEINKDKADYFYNRAVINAYFLKDYTNAIKDYQEALNLKPDTELYQLSLEEAQENLAEEEQEKQAQTEINNLETSEIKTPYISLLGMFRDLTKYAYFYQKPNIPEEEPKQVENQLPVEKSAVETPKKEVKEEKGFYDETLEFNLLDEASRLNLSSAGKKEGVSHAEQIFQKMSYSSKEDIDRLYRAFISEANLVKNLTSLEDRGIENLTPAEKAHYEANFQKTIPLRNALYAIVRSLENLEAFPQDVFKKMVAADMEVDPGARLYFTKRGYSFGEDLPNKVANKYTIYKADPSQDHLFTDISNLVIIVMNDEPGIAKYIAEHLKQYCKNVFEVHTMFELKNTIEMLKQKGLRPHYFINDMNLGHTVSGADSTRVVRQAFPEIAHDIGFIMWSDSSSMYNFLNSHNYIGHVKRVEGEDSTASIKNPAFYISYIESKENLFERINKIPQVNQQAVERVFSAEAWQNLATKDISEIAASFKITSKEIILIDLRGFLYNSIKEKIMQEASKGGYSIKEVSSLEEIAALDFSEKKLVFTTHLMHDSKEKLFEIKKDSPLIFATYEDLTLEQKQNLFADGFEGYYYVERAKKNNEDRKFRPNMFRPMASPRFNRRVGGIFMPFIITSNVVNPKAPKYTEKWASFETMDPKDIAQELNKIDNKKLLVKDKYGKLPIEYALKNDNLVGYVKANDAFSYVYLYSNQAGLEPNTILDTQKGLTLAMFILKEEKTKHPFSFVCAKVNVKLTDKEGNSLLKYLIEGVNPLENAEMLFDNLTPEESTKLVNRKNKQGQGVIEFLDNSSLSSEDKIKLVKFFKEKGLIFDTSEFNNFSSVKDKELRDYLEETLKQIKQKEAIEAYNKKVEAEFLNPTQGQAVMSKEGKEVSLEVLTYVDEKIAAKLITQVKDINEVNKDGFTGLMYAAKNPNPKVVELLLKNGARANIKTKAGRALLIAREANNTEVENILEKKDKIFKQEQKEIKVNTEEILDFNPDKTDFLGQKNLLAKKKDLKGLYVSLENSGDLIVPLENVESLRFLATDSEVKVKEEKLLSSVYESILKTPFKEYAHKVMATLQGNGSRLFILNHGITLKDAL
ncbi:MAG: hypothetical protein II972_04435, partial [Elusimicrobiaceae bacterium]|nr:hypothetical protein [Elusimicrobiaceae bacterium]